MSNTPTQSLNEYMKTPFTDEDLKYLSSGVSVLCSGEQLRTAKLAKEIISLRKKNAELQSEVDLLREPSWGDIFS